MLSRVHSALRDTRTRNRPKAQWIAGGVAAALLGYAVVRWTAQLATVLTDCAAGLGNPGVTGRLTGQYCVLADGTPLLRLPWGEDALITVLLAASLACMAGAVLAPRWSGWSRSLPILAVPVLLHAGLVMATRLHQRADDAELLQYVVGAEAGMSRRPGHWLIELPERALVVPDVGALPLGLASVGGLSLLVLATLLRRDRPDES